MAQLQVQRLCPVCNQARLFTKSGTNHLVHAVVSLFLCGFWIPVWILASLSNSTQPYRCVVCGSKSAGSRVSGWVYGVVVLLFAVWIFGAYAAAHGWGTSHEVPQTAAPSAQSIPAPTQPKIRPNDPLARDQAAAAAGQPGGLLRMADRYLLGDGVAKDRVKAKALYEQAAAAGSQDAAIALTNLSKTPR